MIQIIRFDKRLYSQAALKRAVSAFEKHIETLLIDNGEFYVVTLASLEEDTGNLVGVFNNFVIHMENQNHHGELL